MRDLGFSVELVRDPYCTLAEFARDNPAGVFILGDDYPGGHVVAVVDGNWYDTADCCSMIPEKVWRR